MLSQTISNFLHQRTMIGRYYNISTRRDISLETAQTKPHLDRDLRIVAESRDVNLFRQIQRRLDSSGILITIDAGSEPENARQLSLEEDQRIGETLRGKITPDMINTLWAGRIQVSCFCCGKEFRRSEQDPTTGRRVWECGHIIPVDHNGETKVENLRLICWPCNRGVGGMHTIHMYEYMILNQCPGVVNIPSDDREFIQQLIKKSQYVKRLLRAYNPPEAGEWLLELDIRKYDIYHRNNLVDYILWRYQ